MSEHYLDRLARTINENWDSSALTDFYLTEDGSAQDISRVNHYTYGEMYAEILRLGEMFAALGLKHGDHIAICGANSAHWAIAYLAIAVYQGVAVTILHAQVPEDIARQIDFSDAKALFTDSDLWEELKSLSLPQIEHVICLDNWHMLRGEEIVNLQLPYGASRSEEITNHQCQFDHGSPDDLAMICFTSGSTSNSKGVMLTYGNISAGVQEMDRICKIHTNKNTFIFLPLSHIFSFGGQFLTPIATGGNIYVYRDSMNIKQLFSAVLTIRPYAFFAMPIIVMKAVENVPSCMSHLRFLEYLVIGGAKLPNEVEKLIIQSQLPIMAGYGLTETTGPIGVTPAEKHKFGAAGKVLNTLTARIAPNGEILVKGENVMLGYYKDPEATARKIDKDGWLHTGDKGHLDEDGYLYVEGRLEQDMIVLPNGENIHPEDIERKINALPEVEESIVLARDGKLVAIVVPQITNDQSPMTNTDLRRIILRNVNPLLPLYSQLYDVEISDTPLQKTEKQTIKRYLYK